MQISIYSSIQLAKCSSADERESECAHAKSVHVVLIFAGVSCCWKGQLDFITAVRCPPVCVCKIQLSIIHFHGSSGPLFCSPMAGFSSLREREWVHIVAPVCKDNGAAVGNYCCTLKLRCALCRISRREMSVLVHKCLLSDALWVWRDPIRYGRDVFLRFEIKRIVCLYD
jgi:hypothetical protein